MLYLQVMLPETTILFVTHDIDEALQLSKRLIVLSESPGRSSAVAISRCPIPGSLGSPAMSTLRTQIYHHLGVHAAL